MYSQLDKDVMYQVCDEVEQDRQYVTQDYARNCLAWFALSGWRVSLK